ncbi:MAG: hypothetical protein ACHQET_13565 [Chitinophagales bacterium]
MKTLFTIPMLITIVVTGIISCKLFEKAHYDLSALLTVTSYLSISMLVVLLKSKKMILQ